MIESLLFSWNKNGEYAQRLVADLSDDQMTHQPVADVNHPAWILCHLITYHPVIHALINNVAFDDPKDAQFGMNSKPESDASIYGSRSQLIDRFTDGHNKVQKALQESDESIFDIPMSLPRWKDVMPTVGIAMGYLMLLHESIHLGQFSAWRRFQGLPSV